MSTAGHRRQILINNIVHLFEHICMYIYTTYGGPLLMLRRSILRVRYHEIRRPHSHFCELSNQLFALGVLRSIPHCAASFFVFQFVRNKFFISLHN